MEQIAGQRRLQQQLNKIRHFFKSPSFHEGLTTTAAVVIPLIIGLLMGELAHTIPFVTGSIIASVPDAFGSFIERKKTLMISITAVLVISILSQYIQQYTWLQGIFLPLFTFLCCMLTLFGNRAMGLGSAFLLVVFFNLSVNPSGDNGYISVLLMTAGALWYLFLILSLHRFKPHRLSQQVLGECTRKVGELMYIKAGFFDVRYAVEDQHKAMIQANITLAQRQQEVRELLFSPNKQVDIGDPTSRRLNFIFVHVMDIFERINATHYDYQAIRDKYGDTDSYRKIHRLVILFSLQIQQLSFPIKSFKVKGFTDDTSADTVDLLSAWREAEASIYALAAAGHAPTAFEKMLLNLQHVYERIEEIKNILSLTEKYADQTEALADRAQFYLASSFSWEQFKSHLTFESAIFRHSIRVAIVMFVAFLITLVMPLLLPDYSSLTRHTFWIYITIIVILRPGFAASKQRSVDRLKGSILGGILGVLSIYFISDTLLLMAVMIIYMILTFSFIRTFYGYGSFFLTAFFLIGYYLLIGANDYGLILFKERILDTIIGCVLSFISFFLILPTWESNSIKRYMRETLQANMNFLELVFDKFSNSSFDLTRYKLARKEVYLQLANINSVYERIQNEPRIKRPFTQELTDFLLQTHILTSYTIAFSNVLTLDELDFNKPINRQLLSDIRETLAKTYALLSLEGLPVDSPAKDFGEKLSAESLRLIAGSKSLLTEQLALIRNLSQHIFKTCQRIKELENPRP